MKNKSVEFSSVHHLHAVFNTEEQKKAIFHLIQLLEKQDIVGAKEYCKALLENPQNHEPRENLQPKAQKRGYRFNYHEIIGSSEKIHRVLLALDRIVPTEIPVWIQGESGTGKELIARALHFNHPQRKKHAFVTENCSAIPENLIESLLFGYVKGAFTHAERDKEGLFEAAQGGTIFLDEIGDMPLSMQSKLLRVLQEKEIRRVGSNEAIPIDVRVVSATNKNLSEMVEAGTFREDLYFRLNGFKLSIPPLREHREDIPELCEFFLKKYRSNKMGNWSIEKDALTSLMNYSWPGNVRELENTIHNAMLFSEKNILSKESLLFKPEIFEISPSNKKLSHVPFELMTQDTASNLGRKRANIEPREIILDALVKVGFHKGKAAQELQITTRHLYNLLEKYQLPKNKWELKRLIQEERN